MQGSDDYDPLPRGSQPGLWRASSDCCSGLAYCTALDMANDKVTNRPDPSHDDLSNTGPERDEGIPEFDNESHDRNDDHPGTTPSGSKAPRVPEDTITGKPVSDMAPPGQDESVGNE
jgi:hypothetical protein